MEKRIKYPYTDFLIKSLILSLLGGVIIGLVLGTQTGVISYLILFIGGVIYMELHKIKIAIKGLY